MKRLFVIFFLISVCLLFSCGGDDSDDDCYGQDARCSSTSQCCDGLSCQVAELPGVYRCQ